MLKNTLVLVVLLFTFTLSAQSEQAAALPRPRGTRRPGLPLPHAEAAVDPLHVPHLVHADAVLDRALAEG